VLPAAGEESLPLIRSALLLGITACLPSLTGCARIAYEREQSIAPHHESFLLRATSDEEVMDALGPPQRLSATPTGFAFLYEHIAVEEKQLGVSFEKIFDTLGLGPSAPGGFNIGSIFRLLYAWADADTETLLLEFDHGGTLRTASYDRSRTDLGSTLGISLIVSANRKLGLEDYGAEPAALSWGWQLTQNARTQLNREQDLSTGQSGLARRPANFSVGQGVTLPQSNLKNRREEIKDHR